MSYYTDGERITFDEGEKLVARYIREHRERREVTTAKAVAQKYEIEASQHNLLRINEALGMMCEEYHASGSTATRYKIQ